MIVPSGAVWWWLYMICGYHARNITLSMARVSSCDAMNESRLLSWPMYLWYSRGTPRVLRSSVSLLRMYQSASRSWPSGLACTASTMTSRRNRVVSASVPLASSYTSSISCCAPRTSLACSPPSTQTTARPSSASARVGVRQILGQREPARDLLIASDPGVILRRRDDRHEHRTPLARGADLLQLHPVRLRVDLPPVVNELP